MPDSHFKTYLIVESLLQSWLENKHEQLVYALNLKSHNRSQARFKTATWRNTETNFEKDELEKTKN